MASVAVTKDDLIIGGNIRRLREYNNHTQKYLASHIDYSDNHLCAVENGRKPASATMILRLAEYYDMTLEYFYKGTSLKNEIFCLFHEKLHCFILCDTIIKEVKHYD